MGDAISWLEFARIRGQPDPGYFGSDERAVQEGDRGRADQQLGLAALRADGSRERAPDDRLREAIHLAEKKEWITSSLGLLAMTQEITTCNRH
jgi:hypothetical protein